MDFVAPALQLGTLLTGRYRLERLVGEGASSWVFAATDLRLEREVAVKFLKRRAEPEYSAQRAYFVQEGRMLAKLAHPHVVAVFDAGETPEGDGYLVMELSQAGTLEAELLRRDTLGVGEAVSLIVPLLGALACVHDLGIIHRDLKPANIALVRHVGGKPRAKLLDFGIAQLSGKGLGTGVPIGTPAYMAPEQARAESPSPAADVWAMGAVLFRCLSGRLPFEPDSSAEMLRKLVQQRATRVATLCPMLPPHIAVVVDRALEPDPAQRYRDTRTFARVLGVACRQDGIHVDPNPEPIGLPDFAVWLDQADIETTQRERSDGDTTPLSAAPLVAQTLDGAGAPVAPLESVPARRKLLAATRWPLVAVITALLALSSALLLPWSGSRRTLPASGEMDRRPGLRGERAREPQTVTPPLPAAATSLAAAPVMDLPSRGSQYGRRTVVLKARASRNASAGTVRPEPSSGERSDRRPPGLIADWEW